MNPADFNNWAGGIQSIIATLAILIGSVWALFKFVIYRERFPKIQFDVDLRVMGEVKDQLIVEVVAIVENKGLVRHWLTDFKFDLLMLPNNKLPVEGDQRINNQVLFDKIIKNRYWIPTDWKTTFIDPGICQEYTYVTHLPKNAALALIYATFKYPDKQSNFHTAQKTFKLS